VKSINTYAASVYSADTILRKIAFYVWPAQAIHPVAMSTANKRLCHLLVAQAIETRMNNNDIVWLYGQNNEVYHSVLTTSQHKIIVGDAYASGGRFLANQGFQTVHGTLKLVNKIEVSDLIRAYTH
jgi:hypothetical protein